MKRLSNSVAVVTGANRGIGKAIAKAFAAEGAKLALCARNAELLETAAAELRQSGAEVLAQPVDVANEQQVQAFFKAVMERFGRVDLLVNNAGGWPPQPALETNEESFEGAFHFNVTSALTMTRLCVPHMLKVGGGAIVNISSAAGRVALPGFVAYTTAKAALSHMTKVLGAEFAPKVRVNAIAVGAVETSALVPFLTDELKAAMVKMHPMGRLGQVEDIAACALYLASPAASWVTSKTFEVDGGTDSHTWPFDPPRL
jgi:7-alpha-hydroxysteroid dehydrogenase